MGQERWEDDYRCPCGQGTITYETISYDNGYSPDDRSTSVACPECRGNYTFEHVTYGDSRGSVMTATHRQTRASIELVHLETRELTRPKPPLTQITMYAKMRLTIWRVGGPQGQLHAEPERYGVVRWKDNLFKGAQRIQTVEKDAQVFVEVNVQPDSPDPLLPVYAARLKPGATESVWILQESLTEKWPGLRS